MPAKTRVFVYFCAVFGVLGHLPSLAAAEQAAKQGPDQQGEEEPSEPAGFMPLNQTAVSKRKELSLIEELNRRYNYEAKNCGTNISALNCSGIIVRRSKPQDGPDFWKIEKPAVKKIDSVTFSWLRVDGASDSNDLSSGFIYMDKSTARDSGYELPSPRCIYPVMAGTQNAGRELNGCGPVRTTVTARPNNPDQSYCKALRAEKLDSWLTHFKQTSKPKRDDQCSLSAQDPEQLITSLNARKSLSNDASISKEVKSYGNELLIPLWKEDKVNQLPIEAFFFKTADSGAFDFTLKLRESFYNKTGRMVPLVGVQFSTKDTHVFKPLTRDQQGRATANALNLRYAKTDQNCNGQVSLYCNGVLVRTLKFSPSIRAWNPTKKSVDSGAVSFSYLRADQGIKQLAWTFYQGLIFSELDAVNQRRIYPIEPKCMYPIDGSTYNRASEGCGAHKKHTETSKQCATYKITTFDQYKKHFTRVDNNDRDYSDRNEQQCSLAINKVEFNLAMITRHPEYRGGMLNNQQLISHNELIIKTWPQDIPDLLPLDGFFYQYTGSKTDADALDQAKKMQKDLEKNSNGLWKPVIRLNLAATTRDGFATYRAQDQNQ
ncbi:TPA: hypothetical protein ACKP22_004186 [Pseudomonas putida]